MDQQDNIRVEVDGGVTKSIVIVGQSVHASDIHIDIDNADDFSVEHALSAPSSAQKHVLAVLRSKFSLEEIELVCWELGISFDDLNGSTLTAKALDLVKQSFALGVMDQLIAIVQRDRPDPPVSA